jgi:hypothetical protein
MKIKIPLELIRLEDQSWHLLVRVVLNRTNCCLLLDTGASHTVFDLKYCTGKSSVEHMSSKEVSGVNAQSIENVSGMLKSLKMGELKLKDMDAVFIDLKDINRLYQEHAQKEISGLIGSDFLLKYRALICYDKLKLTLKIPVKRKSRRNKSD